MNVKIITYTPNIENVLASAGRLCYSKVGVEELMNKYSQEDNEKFVKMLADMGHESPLEHVSFTFAVEGISRACSHQLVRHRLASYSQQSQRYVNLDETFSYIIPKEIEKDEIALDEYSKTMDKIYNSYKELTEQLHYKYCMTGMDKREANKKAIEDARYILPNACETKLVFTMNVRTLLHFFEKRCCTRAQWEIRDMANEMLRQCKEICPILFNNAGPACKRKKCLEGNMSCKK